MNRGARLVAGVLALALTLIVAGFVGTHSGATKPSASSARVIDQTLRCSIPRWAGNREITVWAQSGVRESPSRWKSLAAVMISTRGSQISLLQAAAGAPVPTEHKGLTIFDTTLLIGELCRPATARVPLSARGLDGGAADPFGDAYKCSVSRTVLAHVRAAFRSSAFLRRDPRSGARITRTPVRTASVAIRTQSGRPVLFATMLESGKARLFTAGACA
jgi:hypothetical protein